MILTNIFGPSGSGKTTLIKDAAQAGVLVKWIQRVSNIPVIQSDNPRLSLSTMPIPKFRGSVESYLSLFGVSSKDVFNSAAAIQALYNTIFPLASGNKTSQDLSRLVETLSAGEERRLALLRCILEDSQIRVIDEPYANSHQDLHDMILSAIKVGGISILLTHQPIFRLVPDTGNLKVVSVEHARCCLQRVLDER